MCLSGPKGFLTLLVSGVFLRTSNKGGFIFKTLKSHRPPEGVDVFHTHTRTTPTTLSSPVNCLLLFHNSETDD